VCSEMSEDTRLEVQCEQHDIPDHLPPDISLCLYRVAQEALQNIVRHSNARNASVELRERGGRLRLQVVDDGVGFDQARVAAGLGLASMRERLNAVNGDLDIYSQPGRGTRLDAWVELRPAPAPVPPDVDPERSDRVAPRLGDAAPRWGDPRPPARRSR
jgi:signal transduction histidine kinase